MGTIFINTENSKTNFPQEFLKLLQRFDLKKSNKKGNNTKTISSK